MTRILYDLAAADGRRFSPYCWRAKLALAHKGLEFDTVPVPFTQIAELAGAGQTTLPVLEDDGFLVRDSFAIAEYLEDAYPNRPSLFGSEGGRAAARLVEGWSFQSLHGPIVRLIVRDLWEALASEDQSYFRVSREKLLGMTLEEAQSGREERLPAFRAALQPARHVLARSPFLGGKTPLFSDFILFGTLQWPSVAAGVPLLEEDDPISRWRESVRGLYGGLGTRVSE